MRIIWLIVLLVLCSGDLLAQSINGRFEGAFSRNGSVQLVNIDLFHVRDSLYGTYEIPELGLYDVPIEAVVFHMDTLILDFFYGNMICRVSDDTSQVTGISEGWQPKIWIHLKKVNNRRVKPFAVEEINFHNGDTELAGMIYHPKNLDGNSIKYVVMVHGSGHQDRYTPYYVSMAHLLAKNGIGALLYDKRGTGKSQGNYHTSSLHDLSEDARAALAFLKKDLGVSLAGMLGTSQGGWIAPIAATASNDACDFLVLNVSPSVSVFEQDIHRVEYTMRDDGWGEAAIDSAVCFTKLYFDFAKSNTPAIWNKLKYYKEDISGRPWVEYVNLPADSSDFEWWRLNDYDPKFYLTQVSCPTLCLYAEMDRLVPPAENMAKMTSYLETAGVDFEMITVEGAYHNMQTAHGLNGPNWDWPVVFWQWRRQPEIFIESILKFIRSR